MSRQYLTETDKKHLVDLVSQTALSEPRKYKVILNNDDYTPMEFVVDVLKRFFYFNETLAVEVMLQVHTEGKGVCGFYTHDIAETKVSQVNDYSKANEYPLLCSMEVE